MDTPAPDPAADAVFDLVRARYGARLTPEQLADVREAVTDIVDSARALRAVTLGNGDEPMQEFAPFRADG